MASQLKQVVKLAMNGQESLRLPIGAQSPHLAFSGSRVFMGNFRPVVCISVQAVRH
jgi:hypothetical protein